MSREGSELEVHSSSGLRSPKVAAWPCRCCLATDVVASARYPAIGNPRSGRPVVLRSEKLPEATRLKSITDRYTDLVAEDLPARDRVAKLQVGLADAANNLADATWVL